MVWAIMALAAIALAVWWTADDYRNKKFSWNQTVGNFAIPGILLGAATLVWLVVAHTFFYHSVGEPERIEWESPPAKIEMRTPLGDDYRFTPESVPGEVYQAMTIDGGQVTVRAYDPADGQHALKTEQELDEWTFPFKWMRTDQATWDFFVQPGRAFDFNN